MEIKSSGSYIDEGKVFYYPPKTPLLEDPEKQKNFRRDFISSVSKLPDTSGVYL
jgi:hypothetical protein